MKLWWGVEGGARSAEGGEGARSVTQPSGINGYTPHRQRNEYAPQKGGGGAKGGAA